MKCKYCQAEIGRDSLFCPICGKEQPRIKKESFIHRHRLFVACVVTLIGLLMGGYYYLFTKNNNDGGLLPLLGNDYKTEISERLKEIYESLTATDMILNYDSLYCSEAFYKLENEMKEAFDNSVILHNAINDENHWGYFNGMVASEMSIIDIAKLSDTTATAKIRISSPEHLSTDNNVEMVLVRENGNWFVDDFTIGTNEESERIRINKAILEYKANLSKVNSDNCGECYDIDGSKCLSYEQMKFIAKNQLSKKEIAKMAHLCDFFAINDNNSNIEKNYETPHYTNFDYEFFVNFVMVDGKMAYIFNCHHNTSNEEYKAQLYNDLCKDNDSPNKIGDYGWRYYAKVDDFDEGCRMYTDGVKYIVVSFR